MRIESKHQHNMVVDTKPYVFSIGVRFETREGRTLHYAIREVPKICWIAAYLYCDATRTSIINERTII